MNEVFEKDAAVLWRRILRTDPREILGKESERLLNRNWGDRVAQPGFLGAEYAPGGLVFVSMNPGSGGDGMGPEDLDQYRALESFRNARDTDIGESFRNLNGELSRLMPTWKIYQRFVEPVLKFGDLSLSDAGYLNLLKWRTKERSGLNRLYDLSWKDHTREQVELLDPGVVVVIGVDASRAFSQQYSVPTLFSIPLIIGGNIGPNGRAALEDIKQWFETNRSR